MVLYIRLITLLLLAGLQPAYQQGTCDAKFGKNHVLRVADGQQVRELRVSTSFPFSCMQDDDGA